MNSKRRSFLFSSLIPFSIVLTSCSSPQNIVDFEDGYAKVNCTTKEFTRVEKGEPDPFVTDKTYSEKGVSDLIGEDFAEYIFATACEEK